MPTVLIDNDDLSDSEKSSNDYEEDFAINANNVTYATPLMAQINFKKCMLQYLFFSPLILCFMMVRIKCRPTLHTHILVAADGFFGISLIFICP